VFLRVNRFRSQRLAHNSPRFAINYLSSFHDHFAPYLNQWRRGTFMKDELNQLEVGLSRRDVLIGAAWTAAASLPLWTTNAASPANSTNSNPTQGNITMDKVKTKDGTEIFFKDWGTGQPLFFHHGWPLSADDWDAQMMFFLSRGYRVVAHDRRGHGRSTQTANGHDMDTYAADVAEVVKALDLKNAIHIGHSTGGGEVARYVARHGKGRVSKAVLISAIPPTFMKSERNPDGVPKEVVDGIRNGTANHRSQFYKDITIPFYGYNRPGANISVGIQENWWRQGMMGSIQAHYECVRVLSETEFYDDLKMIDVPVLVMHGEDDQICPFPTTGARSVKLLKHGTLKSYPGLPHGMPTTHAEIINADLLTFIKAQAVSAAA
jgi:non-heme chloroperoxidase